MLKTEKETDEINVDKIFYVTACPKYHHFKHNQHTNINVLFYIFFLY